MSSSFKIKFAVWALTTRRKVVALYCLHQRDILGLHTTHAFVSIDPVGSTPNEKIEEGGGGG